jgi:hypothetical protein
VGIPGRAIAVRSIEVRGRVDSAPDRRVSAPLGSTLIILRAGTESSLDHRVGELKSISLGND